MKFLKIKKFESSAFELWYHRNPNLETMNGLKVDRIIFSSRLVLSICWVLMSLKIILIVK